MKTNQVYLIHIRDCLARIEDYTKEGKEFFFKDLKTQDAVIRNLEVMAESIKKLPDEWKQDFQEISWGEITGFRNRLAHEYLGIDIEIVWEVIEVFLPPLTEAITAMTQKYWNV